MALDVALPATLTDPGRPLPQFRNERGHPVAIPPEFLTAGVDVRL
jgi:hypothetical protein